MSAHWRIGIAAGLLLTIGLTTLLAWRLGRPEPGEPQSAGYGMPTHGQSALPTPARKIQAKPGGGCDLLPPDMAQACQQIGLPVNLMGEVQIAPDEALSVLTKAMPHQPDSDVSSEAPAANPDPVAQDLAAPDQAAAEDLARTWLTERTDDQIRIVATDLSARKDQWLVQYTHDRSDWAIPPQGYPCVWVNRTTGEVTDDAAAAPHGAPRL